MTPLWWAGLALASDTHRYALLIGTNDGGAGRATLRYAHDDADAMADVLGSLGGVSSARSRVLYDPDRDAVLAAFAALRDEVSADADRTEVVFYFSGHSDEEGLLLGDELLPWRDLRAEVEGLGADVRLAILDSCASGSLILAKGGTHLSPFAVDVGTQVEGSAYLTSSSADEVSQEGERVGGSYFTYALRTGLLGAADLSGDGRVTLTEAYSFARDETLQQTERTQHGPQHANYDLQLEGSGELVLTELSRRSASLVLGEGVEGRVVVRDTDGSLVAELKKSAAQSTELGLAPGDYVISIVPAEGDEFGEALVTLDEGTSSFVGLDDVEFGLRESTVARKGGSSTPGSELDRFLARFPLDPLRDGDGRTDSMVLGWLGARSSALDGFAFGTAWMQVDGRTDGFVSSLGYAGAGELSGWQLSIGANGAREGSGAQLSVGGNVVTRGFDGLQMAAGFNAAGHGTRGAQLTAGVNLAPGGIRGAQIAAGVNGAGDRVVGAQIAPLNLAADVGGAQIGVLNIARDTHGLQLGVVNVGRDVDGVQFGIVNVANNVRGTPIGLLNFVKEGRHSLLVGATDTDPISLEVKLGDTFFTGLGAGALPGTHVSTAAFAGVHGARGRAWLDVDAGARAWFRQDTLSGASAVTPTVAVRPRVTAGYAVTPWLSPWVSAGVDVRVMEGRPVSPSPWSEADLWPTFGAGVQLF